MRKYTAQRLNEAEKNYPKFWEDGSEKKTSWRKSVSEWFVQAIQNDENWEDDNTPKQQMLEGAAKKMAEGYSGPVVLAGFVDKPFSVNGELREDGVDNAKTMMAFMRENWLKAKGTPTVRKAFYTLIIEVQDFAYYINIRQLKPNITTKCWGEDPL